MINNIAIKNGRMITILSFKFDQIQYSNRITIHSGIFYII